MLWGIIDINAREIVEKAQSKAKAFSVISGNIDNPEHS